MNGKLCGKQSNHRVLKGQKGSRCKQAEFYKRPIIKLIECRIFSTVALESASGKIHIDYKAWRRFGWGHNTALQKNAAFVKHNSPSNFGLGAYSAVTLTVNDETHTVTQTRATLLQQEVLEEL